LQHGNFAAWEEHLAKNFEPQDQEHLRAILAACSRDANCEQLATIQVALNSTYPALSMRELRELLNVLVNDGFFVVNDKRYQFQSGLVRKFWLKYQMD
jgi:hypothetical protein